MIELHLTLDEDPTTYISVTESDQPDEILGLYFYRDGDFVDGLNLSAEEVQLLIFELSRRWAAADEAAKKAELEAIKAKPIDWSRLTTSPYL